MLRRLKARQDGHTGGCRQQRVDEVLRHVHLPTL
jgi:hypothetical protein